MPRKIDLAPQRNWHSLEIAGDSVLHLDQLIHGRIGKRTFTTHQNETITGFPHSGGRKANLT